MSKVEEFSTHFFVTCNYKASFVSAKLVSYIKGCDTAITVVLEVEGGNIIMFT